MNQRSPDLLTVTVLCQKLGRKHLLLLLVGSPKIKFAGAGGRVISVLENIKLYVANFDQVFLSNFGKKIYH